MRALLSHQPHTDFALRCSRRSLDEPNILNAVPVAVIDEVHGDRKTFASRCMHAGRLAVASHEIFPPDVDRRFVHHQFMGGGGLG